MGCSGERVYGLREIVAHPHPHAEACGAAAAPRAPARDSAGYTFRDCSRSRAASALLDAGASVRQIRQALDALRRHDPELEQPLAEVRLIVDGGRLIVESDRVRFDPRTGQTVLDLADEGARGGGRGHARDGARAAAVAARRAGGDVVRASEREGRRSRAVGGGDRRLPAGASRSIPTYAAAWNNLGLLLHRMGHYDEARRPTAPRWTQDERCCQAAYNLGSLHEDLGDVELAIRSTGSRSSSAPDYADAHFNLAGALSRAGRGDDGARALAALRRARRRAARGRGSPARTSSSSRPRRTGRT